MAEIWGAVAAAGISVAASSMAKKSGGSAAATSQGMSEADRKWREDMYERTKNDARINQSSAFGDLTYETDPVTGKVTQKNTMNAADEANLNKRRGVTSQALDRAARPYTMDWDALGLGKFAQAAGVGEWKSGKGLGSESWMGQPVNSNMQHSRGGSTGGPQMGQVVSEHQAAGMAEPPLQNMPNPVAPDAPMPTGGQTANAGPPRAGGMQAPTPAPGASAGPNVLPTGPGAAPIEDPAATAAALRKQYQDQLLAQSQQSGGGDFAGGANSGGGY